MSTVQTISSTQTLTPSQKIPYVTIRGSQANLSKTLKREDILRLARDEYARQLREFTANQLRLCKDKNTPKASSVKYKVLS
ncbi:hypothetical protein BDF14DRAFT_1824731 [Spinellus fusiger]|nr:hypothetical protein BDF14DRAFT_1824731 [Spinellus fusiger]